MMRRTESLRLRSVASIFACLAALFPPAAAIAAEKNGPNIVVVLLDNVGQEWFGCYGSEENCTPNIDLLAATGVRIENCYTPPVCGPSRTVLLTGRYPHTTGFRLHHDAALYSGGGLDPAREVIFPRLIRKAGYATGIAGKWQINNLYDEPGVLARHGFDEQLVWPGSIDPDKIKGADRERFEDIVRREALDEAIAFNQHIESRYWDPVFIRNGQREVLKDKFGPDVCQEFAFDFLRRHRERPFLLYLPMMLTHGQNFSQSVVPTPLNMKTDRPHHEMFADMLRYADKLVGDLVRELDRLGLRDNTILLVASDNGTEKKLQARRSGRLVQGDLYSLTEAGGNVVLLANSPRLVPGGRTAALADFSDIYPTLCELTGVPLDPKHATEGKSLAPYLLGKPGAKPPREWILNEYHDVRVVRDERFKLYSDGRLFDANQDPVEKNNLAASAMPEAVAAKARLQAALASLPPDNPPPFLLRSLSGFKIRGEAKAKKAGGGAKALSPSAIRLAAVLEHKEALAGAHDVLLQDRWAFVAGKRGSIAIVDIADPLTPRLHSFLHDSEKLFDAETVLPLGNHLLLGTRDLLSLDLAALGEPQIVATLADRPRIDRINGFARRDNLVVAANKNGYIDAFDISDPARPKLLGALNIKERDQLGSPHDVDFYGDYAITVDGAGFGRMNRPGKLAMHRVFDSATHGLLPIDRWELVGVVENADLAGANRVIVSGDNAFVGASVGSQPAGGTRRGNGVVVNLRSQQRPTIDARVDFSDPRGPNGSAIAGNVWFLAGGQTVEAYDISEPRSPHKLAAFTSTEAFPTADDNAHDCVYRDGYLYVTSQSDHRLLVLEVADRAIRALADATLNR